MVSEFADFYRYLNHLSYQDFCSILGTNKHDLWAKEKWLLMHQNIGSWVVSHEVSATLIYQHMERQKW